MISFFLLFAITCIPSIAKAHGVGEIYQLPVPLEYYLLGAGLAVAISFLGLSFKNSKKTQPRKTITSINVKYLPLVISFLSYTGVFFISLIIISGIFGSADPSLNIGPTYFWVFFIIGHSLLSFFVGNLYTHINAWAFLTKKISSSSINKNKKLITPWVSCLLLYGLYWYELVSGISFSPKSLSFLLLIYTLININFAIFYKNWFVNAELFTVLFGLIGKLSFLEINSNQKSLSFKKPDIISNQLAPWATLGFIFIMLAATSFDSLKESQIWFNLLNFLGQTGKRFITDSLGLIILPIVFAGLYFLAIWLMKALTASKDFRLLSQKFAWSLLPIAFGYTLAHNLPLLIVSLPNFLAQFSDPLGLGWNLFRTAGFNDTPLILGAKPIWFIEIGLVVLAHIGGIIAAHITALNIFPNRKIVLLSQLPMAALMIEFTVLTLWLLSLPLVII